MKRIIDMRSQDVIITQQILNKHLPSHTDVWVFGSRAKGTARPFSDLDLIIKTHACPLAHRVVTALLDAFEESDLPYKVDIVDWNTISDDFKKLISREKIKFVCHDSI